MKIKLLFFGILKFKLKKDSISIDIPVNSTISDLKNLLLKEYPKIFDKNIPVIYSVNQEYVDENCIIPVGAEIGILPPLSGGSNNIIYSITRDKIDNIEIPKLETSGSKIVFEGTVRNTEDDKKIDSLFYDIYTEMAEKKFEVLTDEIENKYPNIEYMNIIHRVGKIPVGETALKIIVLSPHREEGFDACSYAVTRIKEIVPIFKVNLSE